MTSRKGFAALVGACFFVLASSAQAVLLDLTRDWLTPVYDPATDTYITPPLGSQIAVENIESTGVDAWLISPGYSAVLGTSEAISLPDTGSLSSLCTFRSGMFACLNMGIGVDTTSAATDPAPSLLNGDEYMLLLFSRPVSITRVHLIRYGEESGQRDMPQIRAGPDAVVDFPATAADTTVDNGYAALSVTGSWTSQVDFSQSNLLAPGYALLGVDFSLDPPQPAVSEPPQVGVVPLPSSAWLLAGVLGVLVTRRHGNQ